MAASTQRLAALLRGAEVLYNCASPPYHRWARDWPPLAAALLAAAEQAGVVLVTMGNLYGYGPVDHPISERDPLRASGPKGRVRAALWTQALAAHQAGRVRVTEARAADSFGPGALQQSHLGQRSIPACSGPAIGVFGDPDVPHSWTYLADIAAALATLGTDQRPWGRAWHVPTNPPRSQRELFNALARLAGVPAPSVRALPTWQLWAARALVTVVGELGELGEVGYQFERPLVIDSCASQTTFGTRPTPMPDAPAATLAWVDRAGPRSGLKGATTMRTLAATTWPARLSPATDARLAWRRRVARIGSLIQLGFAALWLGRGTLATGWPARLPVALALVAAAVAIGVWGQTTTRGLAPRPTGPAARPLQRAVTIATVVQLAASFGVPVVAAALGRPDLVVGTVSVTIGMLLLWLRARLRTAGHLVAGVLLIVVPVGLAAVLAGNALTAATGLATGVILTGSAIVGMRSLDLAEGPDAA